MVAMLSSYDSYLSDSINCNRKYIIDEIINENKDKQQLSVESEPIDQINTHTKPEDIVDDKKVIDRPAIIKDKDVVVESKPKVEIPLNNKITLKINKKEKKKCCK